MMMSTLLERFEAVASVFPDAAALVVAFEDSVEFVPGTEPHKAARLEEMLARGGQPLGFLFARREGLNLELGATPLVELENNPEIGIHLQTVLEYWRALLANDGRVAAVPVQ
jgi:hypothetical protein